MDILLSIIAVGVLALYFLPSFIAFGRKHNNRMAILICNLLFGWTFLGWGVCLVWSCTNNTAQK